MGPDHQKDEAPARVRTFVCPSASPLNCCLIELVLQLLPAVIKPAHKIQAQRGKFIIQVLLGNRALVQHTGDHLACPENLQRAQQVMRRLAKKATHFADKQALRERRGAWPL